jgi:ATP-dependent DNA helicase RecQ
MEVNLQSVLLKHWGFSSFRPMQEDIIRSVLSGHDTLALLPTGGGKSICYQVPALALDGLCIVVTPLVALMKDQVQALTNKGIKAVGVYYGLSKTEMDIAIDNCVYGDTKFLYLSPERLTTDLLRSRIGKMKVNLLAVDEAHCISQWGYDFRPPYLRIAEIREFIPSTPVLALTATATSQVVEDIQEKLQFSKQQVFRKSFERKNLAYMVFKEEDKLGRLLKICRKQKGIGVVYVRNRKKTREIAEFLQLNGVSADFYHAGLTSLERDVRQNAWMKERARVMVATNAFGMGIDKPNVRFVVHMDLPESPEAYFQEAGRGGRDGKKSFAVLLYHQGDIIELEKAHEQTYPPVEFIKKVYNSLGNYYQLALGSGKDLSMEFDLPAFSRNYGMGQALVFNALKFLEKEGYIALSEAFANPSRIMIRLNKEELYRFQVANPKFDPFTKLMLRSYPGLFSGFVKISEQEIAKRSGLPVNQVGNILHDLHRLGVADYEKQNERPIITWLEERLAIGSLRISSENHKERKAFALQRLKAMMAYALSDNRCRSQSLLFYFGETDALRCGQCDVCLERNRLQVTDYEFDQLEGMIRRTLEQQPLPVRDLLAALPTNIDEEKVIQVIRWLRDNGQISEGQDGKMQWRSADQDGKMQWRSADQAGRNIA